MPLSEHKCSHELASNDDNKASMYMGERLGVAKHCTLGSIRLTIAVICPNVSVFTLAHYITIGIITESSIVVNSLLIIYIQMLPIMNQANFRKFIEIT